MTFKVLLTQLFLLRRNLAELSRVQAEPSGMASAPEQIELCAETADRLLLKPQQVLFVVAQQHYCEIFWLGDDGPCKHLLRQKIGDLESQFKRTSIRRTHRSYLANLARVTGVSGNAQGYRLVLQGADRSIPLSRSFAAQLLPKIAALQR